MQDLVRMERFWNSKLDQKEQEVKERLKKELWSLFYSNTPTECCDMLLLSLNEYGYRFGACWALSSSYMYWHPAEEIGSISNISDLFKIHTSVSHFQRYSPRIRKKWSAFFRWFILLNSFFKSRKTILQFVTVYLPYDWLYKMVFSFFTFFLFFFPFFFFCWLADCLNDK